LAIATGMYAQSVLGLRPLDAACDYVRATPFGMAILAMIASGPDVRAGTRRE